MSTNINSSNETFDQAIKALNKNTNTQIKHVFPSQAEISKIFEDFATNVVVKSINFDKVWKPYLGEYLAGELLNVSVVSTVNGDKSVAYVKANFSGIIFRIYLNAGNLKKVNNFKSGDLIVFCYQKNVDVGNGKNAHSYSVSRMPPQITKANIFTSMNP
jgi:hypothetical protein